MASVLVVLGAASVSRPTLGPCDLTNEPERYNHQIVQIRGLVAGGGTRLSTEGACLGDIWLEMEHEWKLTDSLPAGHRGPFEPSGAYSVTKGSEEEMFAAIKDDRVTSFFEDMARRSWTPIAPVRPLHDQMWQRFLPRVRAYKSGRPKFRVTATLEGRFDHAGEGFALRSPEGRVIFYRGFGPSDHHQARLVVSRVVSFSYARRR